LDPLSKISNYDASFRALDIAVEKDKLLSNKAAVEATLQRIEHRYFSHRHKYLPE